MCNQNYLLIIWRQVTLAIYLVVNISIWIVFRLINTLIYFKANNVVLRFCIKTVLITRCKLIWFSIKACPTNVFPFLTIIICSWVTYNIILLLLSEFPLRKVTINPKQMHVWRALEGKNRCWTSKCKVDDPQTVELISYRPNQ